MLLLIGVDSRREDIQFDPFLGARLGSPEGTDPTECFSVVASRSNRAIIRETVAAPIRSHSGRLPEICSAPLLRAEAQMFLVVNNSDALDFMDMAGRGNVVDDRYQALSIPSNAGEPVLLHGATTGSSYTQSSCALTEVTWNVRPRRRY